jgi:hypothetical protein
VSKIKEHPCLRQKYLYRVYYYDSPPYSKSKNRPLNGGKHNFGQDALTVHNNKLLSELASADHLALRISGCCGAGDRGWHGFPVDEFYTTVILSPNPESKRSHSDNVAGLIHLLRSVNYSRTLKSRLFKSVARSELSA